MAWQLHASRKRNPAAQTGLKAYGLDPPQLLLDFQLQNGAKHTLAMGHADFSGDSTYADRGRVKSVSLLPKSL